MSVWDTDSPGEKKNENKMLCPAYLKCANITPVSKSGSRNQRDNYRPISILAVIAKIFEKRMCTLTSDNFNIFSKF